MALGLAFRGLLAPVIGIIVDKMGVVRPAALGFALMAGSLAVLAGSNALWHLYAFFGVTLPIGVALCGSVLTTSLVSRLSSPKEGGFSYSVAWTGIHAGRFILPITAAFLLSLWGLRGTFLILAVLAVGIGVAVSSFLWMLRVDGHTLKTNRESVGTQPRAKLIDRFFLLSALAYFVCGYTDAGLVLTHIVVLATDRGIPLVEASSVFGLIGLASFVGTLFFGLMSRKLGSGNTLALIYGLRLHSFIGLLLLPRTELNVYALGLSCLFFGATISTQPQIAAISAARYGTAAVGRAVGVLNSIHWAGGAAGALVGGFLYDLTSNYELAFLSGIVLLMVSTVMAIVVRHPSRWEHETG